MNYTQEDLEAYADKAIGGGYAPPPPPPADDVSYPSEVLKGLLSGYTGEVSDAAAYLAGSEKLAPNPAAGWLPYHIGYGIGALNPYSWANRAMLKFAPVVGRTLPAVAPWIREAIAHAVPNASLQAISAVGRGEDLEGIGQSAGEGLLLGGAFGAAGNKFLGWDSSGPAAAGARMTIIPPVHPPGAPPSPASVVSPNGPLPGAAGPVASTPVTAAASAAVTPKVKFSDQVNNTIWADLNDKFFTNTALDYTDEQTFARNYLAQVRSGKSPKKIVDPTQKAIASQIDASLKQVAEDWKKAGTRPPLAAPAAPPVTPAGTAPAGPLPPAPLSPTGVAGPSEDDLLTQLAEARALNAKLKGIPAPTGGVAPAANAALPQVPPGAPAAAALPPEPVPGAVTPPAPVAAPVPPVTGATPARLVNPAQLALTEAEIANLRTPTWIADSTHPDDHELANVLTNAPSDWMFVTDRTGAQHITTDQSAQRLSDDGVSVLLDDGSHLPLRSIGRLANMHGQVLFERPGFPPAPPSPLSEPLRTLGTYLETLPETPPFPHIPEETPAAVTPAMPPVSSSAATPASGPHDLTAPTWVPSGIRPEDLDLAYTLTNAPNEPLVLTTRAGKRHTLRTPSAERLSPDGQSVSLGRGRTVPLTDVATLTRGKRGQAPLYKRPPIERPAPLPVEAPVSTSVIPEGTPAPTVPEIPLVPSVAGRVTKGEVIPPRAAEWIQDEINNRYAQAEKLGIVQDIEELSAQRLTAREVADRLHQKVPQGTAGVPREYAEAHGDTPVTQRQDFQALVRGVRAKLGIPSMDDKTAFQDWLRQRESAGPIAPPASAAPTPLPRVEEPASEFALPEFPGTKIAPEVVHQEAKVQGIEPDAGKNPAFAEFTKDAVGEAHIDKMTQEQRAEVISRLRAGAAPTVTHALLAAHPELVAQAVETERARGVESFRQLNKVLKQYLTPAERAFKRTHPDVAGFRKLMEHAQEAGMKEKLLEHHMEPFSAVLDDNPQLFRRLPTYYQKQVRSIVQAYETARKLGPANIKTHAEQGIEDRIVEIVQDGGSTEDVVTYLKKQLHDVKSTEGTARQAHAKVVADDLAEDAQHQDLTEGGIHAGLSYTSREGGFQGKTHMAQQALIGNKLIEILGPEEGEKVIADILTGKSTSSKKAPKTHTEYDLAETIAQGRTKFGNDTARIVEYVKQFHPHISNDELFASGTWWKKKRSSIREKAILGPLIAGTGAAQALHDITTPDQEAM